MNHNLRVVEPQQAIQQFRGPHQEIAVYVRNLLDCDYAVVAVPEADSIRIQGFAGRDSQSYDAVAFRLISRLRDWGPAVVDDARLIATPVSFGGSVIGVLVGYSANSGTFGAADLEKLSDYAPVAVGILANAGSCGTIETRTAFTTEELFHLSRLITIGELSSSFAHEVTNPLMLIRGHVRFIEEDLPEDHPLRVNFEVIDRASRRIEEMAKRMLDFSKKRSSRTESCDLADVISDATRFVHPYVQANFIDVQIHVDQQLPRVDADRAQMIQAIVNLLQNAVDAMAETQHRVLSITARVEGGRFRIIVSDTGIGIAPDNLSRIFEPFFTTKGERGTGLGLYITKQVIEDHQGTITVQSSDRGTIFVISLPL
jgi:signal transduction histidine kinase